MKSNASLLDSRPEQKSLVTYHTLRSLCVCVWLVNTSTCTSTAPIVITSWYLRTMGKQWGRNAWRTPKNVCVGDRRTGDEVCVGFGATTRLNTLNVNSSVNNMMAQYQQPVQQQPGIPAVIWCLTRKLNDFLKGKTEIAKTGELARTVWSRISRFWFQGF